MPSVPGDYHFNFGVAKFFTATQSACLLLNKLLQNVSEIQNVTEIDCVENGMADVK